MYQTHLVNKNHIKINIIPINNKKKKNSLARFINIFWFLNLVSNIYILKSYYQIIKILPNYNNFTNLIECI